MHIVGSCSTTARGAGGMGDVGGYRDSTPLGQRRSWSVYGPRFLGGRRPGGRGGVNSLVAQGRLVAERGVAAATVSCCATTAGPSPSRRSIGMKADEPLGFVGCAVRTSQIAAILFVRTAHATKRLFVGAARAAMPCRDQSRGKRSSPWEGRRPRRLSRLHGICSDLKSVGAFAPPTGDCGSAPVWKRHGSS